MPSHAAQRRAPRRAPRGALLAGLAAAAGLPSARPAPPTPGGATLRPASPCWAGDFSVAACCLHDELGAVCWAGGFDRERCCLRGPLLALADGHRLQELSDADLQCGCGGRLSDSAAGEGFDWCSFRRAVMLNWDLRPFYLSFTRLTVEGLAACPFGALTMMLFDVTLKLSSGRYGADLRQLPSFLWAEEALAALLHAGRVTTAGMAASGWMVFFHVSAVRATLAKRGLLNSPPALGAGDAAACAAELEPGPAAESERALRGALQAATSSFAPLSLDMLFASLLHAATGGCGLASAAVAFAAAYALAQRPAAPEDARQTRAEVASLLAVGDKFWREASPDPVGGRPLSLLLTTPWPLAEQADLLCFPGRVEISVEKALAEQLELPEDYPLRVFFSPDGIGLEPNVGARSSLPGVQPRYVTRVFPHREMVSDMIRFSGLPFCGLRPFMRMVASIAESALGSRCPTDATAAELVRDSAALDDRGVVADCALTVVEGGPHLGDCALWAASVLSSVGVQLRAIAFEPLPDASALFRQSVAENGHGGAIEVRAAALGRASHGRVELWYYNGHNGQATVKDEATRAIGSGGVTVIPDVPQVALDQEVPAGWPVVDVLKLSVNGAERDTLAGARRLLSARRVCSVLMHAQKAARGRPAAAAGGRAFSADLLRMLEAGDLEVYTHRDDGAAWAPGAGAARRAAAPADLDHVFDDPGLSQKDYILARSRAPRCASIWRHFPAAFGGQLPSLQPSARPLAQPLAGGAG